MNLPRTGRVSEPSGATCAYLTRILRREAEARPCTPLGGIGKGGHGGFVEPRPQCHDVIVIGGSARSLEALQQLMRDLPADLPAAVFIVVHVGATSYLAHILRRNAAIQVKRAEAGERIEWGRV